MRGTLTLTLTLALTRILTLTLTLTAQGARNRAVAAHAEACRALPPDEEGAVLALGIESGIFEVSGRHYDGSP